VSLGRMTREAIGPPPVQPKVASVQAIPRTRASVVRAVHSPVGQAHRLVTCSLSFHVGPKSGALWAAWPRKGSEQRIGLANGPLTSCVIASGWTLHPPVDQNLGVTQR